MISAPPPPHHVSTSKVCFSWANKCLKIGGEDIGRREGNTFALRPLLESLTAENLTPSLQCTENYL